MKNSIFYVTFFLSVILLAASCKKSNTTVAVTTPEGNWIGNKSGLGGPSHYFSLNFKSGGSIIINEFNATSPDIANGTWSLVGDSVKANFTYVPGSIFSGAYSIAAKYSASSAIMDGTVGVGNSTSGSGFFSVTKQ